jgi:preprotein translocase subunit SecY
MFMVLPMLGWSALMLVPSSIALFNHEVRERTYFNGNFWLNLWKVNLVISVVYIAAALYFAYLWFKASTGN